MRSVFTPPTSVFTPDTSLETALTCCAVCFCSVSSRALSACSRRMMSWARWSNCFCVSPSDLAQLVGRHSQAGISLTQLRIQLGILLVGFRQRRLLARDAAAQRITPDQPAQGRQYCDGNRTQ